MKKTDYRILFMGTPKISADLLEMLLKANFNIIGVIAQEDKEIDRKKRLIEVPTKVVAKKYNVPVYQPHKIRLEYEFVNELKPDLILTFAYGQIIPQELINIPKFGCLNLHGSLLPKYRGAAPIQRAIINGDKTTGITLMEMVAKMDAGKMFYKEEIEILEDDNYSTLQIKLSNLAFKIIDEQILNYFEGKLIGIDQNEDEVTFADKITVEMEHLNLNLDSKNFVNLVKGLSYEPGGYLFIDNEKLKILKAKVYDLNSIGEIGKVSLINKHFVLQTQKGLVEILEIKPQGKNIMKSLDYINGHKEILNKILK